MNCLKNYLKVNDLNNIVKQYLIGNSKNACNINKSANYYGADLFITEPLLDQLCCGDHILLVKKYIDSCVFDKNIINKNIINNGLEKACINGNLKLVQFLVEHGRKLNAMLDLNGGLEEACINGHLKIVQYLIECGADNMHGGLLYACRSGHLKIVQFLVESEKNLDTYSLNVGLSYACGCGHLEVAQYLVEHNADDLNDGLRNACYNGHLELIEFLVESGANDFGNALYSVCCKHHFASQIAINIAKYLIEHREKSCTNLYIFHCINLARKRKNLKLANYLLSLSF